MKVSEYRDFLRLAEILIQRTNYEDILFENKIFLNKKLTRLDRNSAPLIIQYFKRKSHPMAETIVDLCEYYLELLAYEKLEII